MLEHGGNLNDAMARYRRPRHEWLDLSTGINPQPYPVPPLPADAWHRLPEPNSKLIAAACAYYNAPRVLAVAGSQAAIQALPRLRPPGKVIVASPAYAEHAHCWAAAGHAMREVAYERLEDNLDHCDVMVVCNPGNPTGARVAPQRLAAWADRLAARRGWLVVDEAFADTTPDQSVAARSGRSGLIVLRSLGKFFGLAGLRLGFAAAHEALLAELAEAIGPWTVSGPAQQIGCAALSDHAWQIRMRRHLSESGARLHALLAQHGVCSSGSALYQWWPEPDAEGFHRHMAGRGIWVRLFTRGAPGIRMGLPPDEDGWRSVEQALAEWTRRKRTQ